MRSVYSAMAKASDPSTPGRGYHAFRRARPAAAGARQAHTYHQYASACRAPAATPRTPPDYARNPRPGALVGPLLGLPLGDRHGRVGDSGRVAAVHREVDVLEPLVVVALREVQPELRAARLAALQRGDDDALGAVEHEAELERAQHVLVEDRAAIVDRRAPGLLLEAPDDLVRLQEP